MQALELVAAEIRYAKVQHLAILLQLAEGAGDLVEIHQRVGTVDQQQVQAVRVQLAQGLFHGAGDVRRARVVMLDGVTGAVRREQLDAALADQLHLVAQARLQGQRFAK